MLQAGPGDYCPGAVNAHVIQGQHNFWANSKLFTQNLFIMAY